MRLLILSDSHGAIPLLERILTKEGNADAVFFLGDGVTDLLSMKKLRNRKNCFINRGNCDSSMHPFPAYNLAVFSRHNVFACHGHLYAVKNSLTTLMYAALEQNADICLYGHTHLPSIDFRNGILFLNPGAVVDGRYGTIDIEDEKQPYPTLHNINK